MVFHLFFDFSTKRRTVHIQKIRFAFIAKNDNAYETELRRVNTRKLVFRSSEYLLLFAYSSKSVEREVPSQDDI